jgi:hypothetical protein
MSVHTLGYTRVGPISRLFSTQRVSHAPTPRSPHSSWSNPTLALSQTPSRHVLTFEKRQDFVLIYTSKTFGRSSKHAHYSRPLASLSTQPVCSRACPRTRSARPKLRPRRTQTRVTRSLQMLPLGGAIEEHSSARVACGIGYVLGIHGISRWLHM